MFKTDLYVNRRNRLKHLIESGLILLMGNELVSRNSPDNRYPFRQDSNFLYYCGINEPSLALVLDVDSGTECLYGPQSSNSNSIWEGISPSTKDWAERAGIENAAPKDELAGTIQKALKSKQTIHLLPHCQADVFCYLEALFSEPRQQVQRRVSRKLTSAVISMRSFKDEHEIKEMESALKITRKMFSTAMIMAMPGAHERDIKGVIEGIAVSQGGAPAFQPIVSTHGEILHNPRYTNTLEQKKILLVDAGSESANHYASDITRSIPVGRQFSRMHRDIYEIVLKANLETIASLKPGIPYRDYHLKACRTLAEGLKELGLMRGDCEEAVENGAHALFFPHGLGHLIGLDVHDMGVFNEDDVGYSSSITRSQQFGLRSLRFAKELQPGYTLTVEPGLYFIPQLIDQWSGQKKLEAYINYAQVDNYRHIGGIRIEDEVVITENGCRELGPSIPKSVKELETL